MKNLNLLFKAIVQRKARWLLTFIAILTLGVGQMWGTAKQRYIYVGISKTLNDNIVDGQWGFNVWGGTSAGVKSCTYIADLTHDGRNYKVFRAYVHDDNNKAQFKCSDSWWEPGSGTDVDFSGTTNNAVFFSHSDDGWGGQFQRDFQVESTASLSATKTQMTTAQTSTLTPSLSSNATYNEIKSTTYSVTTNPGSGGSVTSAGVFSATKTGTYTVTATVTYNAKDFTGITKTATATQTITVMGTPVVTLTVDKVNVNQITLTGTITNYNNSGSNASDMSEVGFYIGATKYTATYKSGNTFTKTITGLTANNAYANVKAFATNALSATGNSSTTTVTTLADATYRIQVRAAHNATAPHIYAWTDADSYGGSKMENATYASAPAMTLRFAATTYDWYYYDVNNKYEKFLINTTGDSDKSTDFSATRTADCFWYNASAGAGSRAAKMDCPEFEPQLVLKVGGGSDSYYEMDGSGTVTKSQSLSAGTYSVKIMYNTEYYGKESSSIARTGTTSSNSITSMAVDAAYITLTADLAGTYTFSFNTSTKALTVTYPEAYRVTFSAITVGGGTGNSSAPTASYNSGATSVTSGTTWIPTGTTVDFTAKSANGGYTFKGWYSTNTPNQADWSENRLVTTAAYSPTINSSAVKTIYAVYDENDYTVSVNKTTGGTLSSDDDITGHKTTQANLPTATANPGYRFVNWTTTGGTLTNASSATTAKINGLTAAATVTANFEPIWRIVGGNSSSADGADAMGDWSNSANKITNITTSAGAMTSGYVDVTLPANTDFQFKVYQAGDANPYWGNTAATITKITYSNKATAQSLTHNSGNNQTLLSAGAGSYRFTWDVTNSKVSVGYPTSYTVTFGKVVDNGQDKGSVTATGDDGAALASGKYVAKGSATFTAASAPSGYRFVDWRDNSTYGGGSQLSTANPYTMTSIAANKTVFANYAENKCTVTITTNNSSGGSITVGGEAFDWDGTTAVGVYTTKALVATPAEGYYFAGWTLSAYPDFAVGDATESGKSTTLRGLGGTHGSTGTLTANFIELDKVYFKNWNEEGNDGAGAALWTNVYAYFGISFDANCAKTANTDDTHYRVLMTREGESNIYWAYVPRAVYANTNIAFSNHLFAKNTKFNSDEGVQWGSYNRALNMCVPKHDDTETLNGTKFYKSYWKNHNLRSGAYAGYSIQRWNGSAYVDPASKGDGDDFQFIVADENTIQYQLRIDNSEAGWNKYRIYSAGNIQYITLSAPISATGKNITSSDCSNVEMTQYDDGSPTFYITPTAEGIYTLTIDQSTDKMKLTVNYPISVNDYRLHHTYVIDAKTYHSYSDVIKAGSEFDSVSMYINTTAATKSLLLEKCTSISPRVVWTDQSAGLSVTTGEGGFNKGNGVYMFAFADAASSHIISGIEPYSGNYYIKTDCAAGGWTAYKNNILSQNTINTNAFDYYFVKDVDKTRATGDAMNLKFVIANDYNIAVSDTLVGDDILGTYIDDGGKTKPYETLPSGTACVRFSYNSKTNTPKRTYLLKSATSTSNVKLVPGASGYVYSAESAGTDYYSSNPSFINKGNWTYQLDAWVYPGATGGVQATYPSGYATPQTLVATSNSLMGGTKDTKRYNLRLVYDYKTEMLSASWMLPDGDIESAIPVNADILVVRHGQVDSPTQLTFRGSGKLTNIKKIVGAIEFRKDSIVGNVGSFSEFTAAYRQLMYYISFPFDVKVNDIYGMGQMGREWIIQKYDGAERAKKGFFRGDGTTTFWKTLTAADTLKANIGYSLLLDNDYFNTNNYGPWKGVADGGSIYLFFPSMNEVSASDIIKSEDATIIVPKHECKIDRTFIDPESSKTLNHKNTDSHWNMMGVPLFENQTGVAASKFITEGADESTSVVENTSGYFYEWNWKTNRLSVRSTTGYTFMPMNSYMVQYCGDVTFHGSSIQPAAIAARRTQRAEQYAIDLQLLKENERVSRTYVELREEACDTFALNEDVYMITTSSAADLYTYAGDYDVAANVLSVSNHTVQVGLTVRQAGTYTFSMPADFSGTATLIDTSTGTRTNLSISDYEVSLPKGACNNRFLLEVDINNAPTAIDGTENGEGTLKDGKAHKFIRNGMMYILHDGIIYDAQGRKAE